MKIWLQYEKIKTEGIKEARDYEQEIRAYEEAIKSSDIKRKPVYLHRAPRNGGYKAT